MKHTIREAEYRHMRIDTLMRFYSQLVDEGIIPPGGTSLTLKKNALHVSWEDVQSEQVKAEEARAERAVEKRAVWHKKLGRKLSYTYYLVMPSEDEEFFMQCEWHIPFLTEWPSGKVTEDESGTLAIILKKLPSKLQEPDEADAAKVLKKLQMAKKLRPIGMAEIEPKKVAEDIDERRI